MKIYGKKDELKHILSLLYKDEVDKGPDPQDACFWEDEEPIEDYCDRHIKEDLREIELYSTDFSSDGHRITLNRFIDNLDYENPEVFGTDYYTDNFEVEWKTVFTEDIYMMLPNTNFYKTAFIYRDWAIVRDKDEQKFFIYKNGELMARDIEFGSEAKLKAEALIEEGE